MVFNIIRCVAVLFFVGAIAYAIFYIQKVKRDGLDAVATVSRYEIQENSDGDSVTVWYVEYRTAEGETVEGRLANPKRGMEVGRKMRIKYLPKQAKSPVFIEYL